jgi:hypothetical protein
LKPETANNRWSFFNETFSAISIHIFLFFSDTDEHVFQTFDDEDSWEDLDDNDENENVNFDGYSDDDELLESDDDSFEFLPDASDITRIMNKCRSIINTIRKSSILYEIILNLARSSSIKSGLVLDMKVRCAESFILKKVT